MILIFTTRNLIKQIQSLFILSIIVYASSSTSAQTTKKKLNVRMSLSYFDMIDDSRNLTANLFIIENRERVPIVDQFIYFYTGEIDENNLIDSIKTDTDGQARLIFDKDYIFANEDSRRSKIVALFKGNDGYKARSADIEITKISMELFLTELEDQKTVIVRGYELGLENSMTPINDASVSFFVPRFFSDQKIGEGDFIDGKCQIEFPENIAGDTIGNISILARIQDHEFYGNVERKMSDFRWGTTEPIEEDKSLMTIQITIPTRALWHTNAPLWMIITLIVLLTGVWSHYIYVIVNLFRLRNLSRKKTTD